MTIENIPWAVSGGKHSASVARMVAYAATGGAEGISGLGDLLVRQTTVASGNVRIGSGGAVLINRYPGVKNESYILRAGDETQVAVPANASGTTRYDLVVARVDDWNFPGAQAAPSSLPTDTVPVSKFQVITGVASSTTKATDLGLNYPAVALARIAIPGGTSSVTQAMITDLREMAQPRRKRDLRAKGIVAGRDDTLDATAGTGELWPNDGAWTVEVPEWATKVVILGTWGSILAPGGQAFAKNWLSFGYGRADVQNTQASNIDFTSFSTADPSRITATVADTLTIPKSMRGQSVSVYMMGQKINGPALFKADASTSVSVDMEFLEAPTEDI